MPSFQMTLNDRVTAVDTQPASLPGMMMTTTRLHRHGPVVGPG